MGIFRRICLTLFSILVIFLTSKPIYAATYDWYGTAGDNAWANKTNWRVLGGLFGTTPGPASNAPTATDDVQLGVNQTFSSLPIISTTVSCKSLSFGTLQSTTLTVNGSLTVTGAIIQQPSAIQINILTSNVITGTLAGSGSVTCGSLQAGDLITTLNVLALSINFVQFISTVNSLYVTGNVNVYSTTYLLLTIPLGYNNAALYLRGGTTTVDGKILTSSHSTGLIPIGSSNAAATFSVDVPAGSALNPVLKLTNVTPIDPSSITGSIDFYGNSGTGARTGTCTVEYAGTAAQTVYTENQTILDISPSAYQNLTFSAVGAKNITAGNLTISGNWSSASGKVDVVTNNPTVTFQGTTQSLTDGGSDAAKGVVFRNVLFKGGGTKTISSGNFAVNDVGVLSVKESSTLAAGGNLTLQSDAVGSASVDALPLGSSISGNVNVQRFIQGSSTSLSKRGYRFMSSAVYTATLASGAKVFDFNYLLSSIYLSGATGGGFNVSTSTNPSLYLYREDLVPLTGGFTTGSNYKGISKINNTNLYDIGTQKRLTKTNINDTTVNVPVGNGFLMFFRGDKTDNATQTGTKTLPPYDFPENVTLTQVGNLNTGTVDVILWFRTDKLLSYTNNSLQNALPRGHTFVGNPYASTINWEKFNRASTLNQSSIYGANFPDAATTPTAIWFTNPSTHQFDAYIPKSGTITTADTTTTVNPSALYTGAASNMIATGQGFFIQATAANQSLSFRETAKSTVQPTASNLLQLMSVHTPVASIDVPAAPNPEADLGPDAVMALKMSMDSINTDEIAIGFNYKCSPSYINGEDAEDMGGNGALLSLSILSADSVNLAISRVPLLKSTQQVYPLFVSSVSSGLFKLELSRQVDLPAVYEVWLKDAFTNDSLDMRANKIYSFNIYKDQPSTYGNKRFSLVIRPNQRLALHLLNFTATKVTTGVKTAWLVENEANYTSFSIERSTDNGKTFDSLDSTKSTSIGNYGFTDKFPAKGVNVYRLKLNYMYGQISYSKSISINYDSSVNNLVNNLNIFPNPTTASINFMMPADAKGNTPSYNVQIINSAGSILKKMDSSAPHWQNDVSKLLPGTYLIQVTNNDDKTVWGVSKFVKK